MTTPRKDSSRMTSRAERHARPLIIVVALMLAATSVTLATIPLIVRP